VALETGLIPCLKLNQFIHAGERTITSSMLLAVQATTYQNWQLMELGWNVNYHYLYSDCRRENVNLEVGRSRTLDSINKLKTNVLNNTCSLNVGLQ